jgi:hypothetical protein
MATNTLQAPPTPHQTRDDGPEEADRVPSGVESKAAAAVTKARGTADARIAEKDAESARRLRERAAEVELRRQEAELAREKREAKATAKAAKKTASAQRRAARRQARTARATATYTRVRTYLATNAPAVYSAVIYAMALYVAVSGQLSMATSRGWSPVFGIGMAVFLEGLALSMALTAHQLRLRNERALIPAALTWVAAGFASAINYLAHRADDPILAVVLGASSLAAITVWEVRSGAKHRAELRASGDLPEPPERFGWRRWLRYPRSTWRAWSLDVRDRVSDGAARLLAKVAEIKDAAEAERAAAAARAAQWGALAVALAAANKAAAAEEAADWAVELAGRAAAPKRGFFDRFKRAAKEAVNEIAPVAEAPAPVEEQAAPKAAPAPRKPRPTATPVDAAPRPEVGARADVEERRKRLAAAWDELAENLGRWPTIPEIVAATGEKRSTVGDWRKRHVDGLKAKKPVA